MSKRRKMKRHIRSSKGTSSTECKARDRHHLMWTAKSWDKYWASRLRLYPWFIVPIPKCTLHFQIHQEVSCIPVPSEPHCREAYETVRGLERRGALSPNASVETRLELLVSLFDCVEPATARALKQELAIVKQFYSKPP